MSLLALIPARGGSKGVPGKALRPLAGLPLIAHSIELARRCPEIERLVVSTDSAEIAAAARTLGAEVPFLRPAALAQDETPMWPVVRHALAELDPEASRYATLLLLQPTCPGRLPADVSRAAALLASRADVDGVIGVSEPSFNPISDAVVESDGVLRRLVPDGARYSRRQDVPRVLRINGSLYLWRCAFIRSHEQEPADARYLGCEIPDRRAIDIDSEADLELAELVIRERLVDLPWLT